MSYLTRVLNMGYQVVEWLLWPLRYVLLLLIRGYQILLSPLTPPSCRFEPTCSHYGYEAIRRYGVFKGVGLTVWRILRCNPFVQGGYDPVP